MTEFDGWESTSLRCPERHGMGSVIRNSAGELSVHGRMLSPTTSGVIRIPCIQCGLEYTADLAALRRAARSGDRNYDLQ